MILAICRVSVSLSVVCHTPVFSQNG